MKRSLVALAALALATSACGSGTDDDARNVTIPGRDVLAQILPVGVTFAPGQTAAVAVAGNAVGSCVIDHQGGLWCWGRPNNVVTVGMADVSNVPVRMQIPGGLAVTAVSSGDSDATCAVASGRVYCWGANNFRQAVPTSASMNIVTPTLVEGLADVVDVATSYMASCARKTDGSVWCWGTYLHYGLGGAAYANGTVGGPVALGNLNATKIVGAGDTFCVLTANGSVLCWGKNQRGIAGVGNLNPVLNPTPARLMSVVDISMSDTHACAVLVSGDVQCWGNNNWYQVGNVPLNSYILEPNYVDLRGDRAMSITLGSYTSCMLTTLNEMKCWGRTPGTNNGWWAIVAIPNMTNAMMIDSTSQLVFCAVQWTGEVRCVGSDNGGMLGDGGANVTSTSGVRVGSFGTAGVPVPTTSTSVAPSTSAAAGPSTSTTSTPTTSTTIAVASEPTITVAPIPSMSAAPATTLTTAGGATAQPPATETTGAPTSSIPVATTPAGQTAAPQAGGSGVDAAGTGGATVVTVPPSVAPGAVARVLVIKKGRSVSDATIARFAGVGTPKKSKVSVTVSKSTKKFCARNGAKITGAKRGTCTLTVKVTPKGQKPRVRVVSAQVVG